MASDVDRLRLLIDASGLSQVRFAKDVLGRDPRTVRNWLAGGVMPESVCDWLKRLTQVESDPERVKIEVVRS